MDDMISRQAVKELAHKQMREKYCGIALKEQRDFYIKLADSIIDLLPSAIPYTIHSDGRLWVTVDNIDNVRAVVVDEHKSKFCKQFYEDARPEPHWIPCSERLPENNDPVNVTWVNRNPEVYYADIKDKPFTATAHYHRGHWYWYSSVTQDNLNEYGTWIPDLVDKDVEITAWCELPEPFKGVTE